MKTLFTAFALTLSVSAIGQSTFCTTKELERFDPHQGSGPLENYLASRLYLPFFSAKTAPGVITGTKKLRNLVWELEVSPDISFQEFNGWKPRRKLNAEDVVFSIQRQLAAFAKSVADQDSYIPVKINGLEKNLAQVKAISPTKVELTFRKEVVLADLERYFAFPVGVIVSKEYADSGKPLEFLPGYGKFAWKKISPARLSMKAREGNETQDLLITRSGGLTYKTVQDKKCKRLYYAPSDIVSAAREKKISATAVPTSSAKLYFRMNPVFAFAADVTPYLAGAFRPEAYPSLSKRDLKNQFFGNGTKASASSPKKKLPRRSAYVYYCSFPQLSEEELQGFTEDFRQSIRSTLNIDVALVPLNCDQLAGIRPAADTLGTLNAFEYRSQAELLSAFNCETVSREIFGICQNHVTKGDVIDKKLSESRRIYPIAELESFLVEAY